MKVVQPVLAFPLLHEPNRRSFSSPSPLHSLHKSHPPPISTTMSDGKISAPVSGPSVPVQTLHDVFGTLLVGTWVNCMMFMLEVVLIVRYFERFSSDRLWIRVLVVSMFVIDIAGTCAFCALGYTVRFTICLHLFRN